MVLKENNVLSPEVVTCPDYLLQLARNCPPVKTAIVGTGAQVVLESVRASVDAGIIDPVLIGEPDLLAQIGDEIGFDVSHHEIISTPDEKAMGEAGADNKITSYHTRLINNNHDINSATLTYFHQ